MPAQRSGFGGRTASSLNSTSGGKQGVSDRGSGADSVIRSVSGADLATWLDSDHLDRAVNVAHSTKISSWTAKEGNSTATESDAEKRPTFTATGFNGRPAVNFITDAGASDKNDVLQWTNGQNATPLIVSDAPANTIISVTVTANDGGNAMIFEMGADVYAAQALAQYYNGSNKFINAMGATDAGHQDRDESTVADACPDIHNVGITVCDRALAYTLSTYINGEPAAVAGKDTGGSHGTNTAWSTLVPYLGARANGASLSLNGHVREFIVLKRALTSGEACRIGKALMFKSGITSMYAA